MEVARQLIYDVTISMEGAHQLIYAVTRHAASEEQNWIELAAILSLYPSAFADE